MRRLRESLGISADGSEKAFAQRDIEDMLARQAPELEYSARDPRRNTQHVFLAVDPSGGGASAFSICSILQDPNGFMHVRLRIHTHTHLNPQPSTLNPQPSTRNPYTSIFLSSSSSKSMPMASPGHNSHNVHTSATKASGV